MQSKVFTILGVFFGAIFSAVAGDRENSLFRVIGINPEKVKISEMRAKDCEITVFIYSLSEQPSFVRERLDFHKVVPPKKIGDDGRIARGIGRPMRGGIVESYLRLSGGGQADSSNTAKCLGRISFSDLEQFLISGQSTQKLDLEFEVLSYSAPEAKPAKATITVPIIVHWDKAKAMKK